MTVVVVISSSSSTFPSSTLISTTVLLVSMLLILWGRRLAWMVYETTSHGIHVDDLAGKSSVAETNTKKQNVRTKYNTITCLVKINVHQSKFVWYL